MSNADCQSSFAIELTYALIHSPPRIERAWETRPYDSAAKIQLQESTELELEERIHDQRRRDIESLSRCMLQE